MPCEGEFDGIKGMPLTICNGKGLCVSEELNPCVVHGCEGKECGEECLMGDIMGWCDAEENCGFSPDVECSNILIISDFHIFYRH